MIRLAHADTHTLGPLFLWRAHTASFSLSLSLSLSVSLSIHTVHPNWVPASDCAGKFRSSPSVPYHPRPAPPTLHKITSLSPSRSRPILYHTRKYTTTTLKSPFPAPPHSHPLPLLVLVTLVVLVVLVILVERTLPLSHTACVCGWNHPR